MDKSNAATPAAKFKVGDKVITSRGYTFDGQICTVVEIPVPWDTQYYVASPTYKERPQGWPVYEWELNAAPITPNRRGERASHPVNQKVLRHLKRRKTISPLEALMTYSISRLAPAIHDLRSEGHQIKTEVRRDAQGHRYARYTLTQLAT